MTRMDRAMAHLALFPPRRRDRRLEPFAEEGVRAGGAGGGLGAVGLEAGVALSFARPAAAGAGLAGDGGEAGPGDQVVRGGEPGHVQARFGDHAHGQLAADAGDLREPARGGQGGGVRGGDAVGGDAPGCVDGVQGGLDLILDRVDRPVEQGDVVQVDADQHGVAAARLHALQGPLDGGAAAPDPRAGQGREGLRVALAVGDGLQDVAARLGPGQRPDHRPGVSC